MLLAQSSSQVRQPSKQCARTVPEFDNYLGLQADVSTEPLHRTSLVGPMRIVLIDLYRQLELALALDGKSVTECQYSFVPDNARSTSANNCRLGASGGKQPQTWTKHIAMGGFLQLRALTA